MANYFERNQTGVSTKVSRTSDKLQQVDYLHRDVRSATPPQMVRFTLMDGTVLEADTGSEIIIGRRSRPEDPPVTIDLQPHGGHQMGVSRVHAMCRVYRGTFTLRDLDTTNGTRIDDHLLTPLQPYIVEDGDIIKIGDMAMQISFIRMGRF